MKVRIGFVSNSSTSSFLIYGTTIGSNDIEKAYNKFFPSKTPEEDEDRYTDERLDEILQKEEFKKYRLETWHPDYDDENYIGACWSSVGDDETGKQFKERVEKQLKSIFGDDISCGTLSAAWREG